MKRYFLFLVVGAFLGFLLVGSVSLSRAQTALTQEDLTTTFTYQGFLMMGGQPANGQYDFQFKLYDAPTAGNQVGDTVSMDQVQVNDGVFTVLLTFDASVFDGHRRWLEVAVRDPNQGSDYTVLEPRQELTATPYAIYSLHAPWSGLTGIPAGFADGVDNDTLAALPCTDGQLPKWDGSAWVCGEDSDTTYTAGTGLVLSGGAFSLAPSYQLPQGCNNGQVPSWNGSQWTCTDAGSGDITAVNAGTGLTGGGESGDVTLGIADSYQLPQGCGDGQVATWDNTQGKWTCADAGNGDITAVNAGTGLTGGGDSGDVTLSADTDYLQRRVSSACDPGYAIRAINADGTVVCEKDDNTTTFWSLTGNGGTDPSTNFLGTTDNQPLEIRVFNTRALRLEPGVRGLAIWVKYPNIIAGESSNFVASEVRGATISGGGPDPDNQDTTRNVVYNDFGTIGGGAANSAGQNGSDPTDYPYATVGGGTYNHAYGAYSMVGGGAHNTANGTKAMVGGGGNNTASGTEATVGGGGSNTASGDESTVAGGRQNTAGANYATVGGGYYNQAAAPYATIAGGGPSDPDNNPDTTNNQVTDDYGTIGGGGQNRAGNGDDDTTNAPYATVGGGEANTASAGYGTIAGGRYNTASGDHAAVGGGFNNTASSPKSTVAGGDHNTASGTWSAVGGGENNTASGTEATVGGGGINAASGDESTVAGGRQNTAGANYATVGGGYYNQAAAAYATIAGGGPSDPENNPDTTNNQVTDDYGTIGGGGQNRAGNGDDDITNATYATVAGGENNTASGEHAAVGGGLANTASGQSATVAGGDSNTASGEHAAVGGGLTNVASSKSATVAGGHANTASGGEATVGGGGSNTASGFRATVSGGFANAAGGQYAAVGGGYYNQAAAPYATIAGGGPSDPDNSPDTTNNQVTDDYGTIGGGGQNRAGNGDDDTTNATYATVAGGENNTASGDHAVVGGGFANTASGQNATVAGGIFNTASGQSTTVAGGENNTASGPVATVGGGGHNAASNDNATVAGGSNNTASGGSSVVAGGYNNTANGDESTVGGGANNQATAFGATIPGGDHNTAEGNFSLAAGKSAHADANGCFVWGDSSTSNEVTCDSTANRTVFRSTGGFYIYTSSDLSTGVFLPANGNSWSAVSDRATKDDFTPVDKEALLARLAAMPVRDYHIKGQDPSIRHVGPVAQDFYAAFGYGETDHAINMEDAVGVSFAAIQGLYAENQQIKAENQQLKAENAALRAQLADQQRQLNALSARVDALEQAQVAHGWASHDEILPVLGLLLAGIGFYFKRRKEVKDEAS